jgi:hypothetical protein
LGSLTEEKLSILKNMALLPVEGIETETFFDLTELDDFMLIDELIEMLGYPKQIFQKIKKPGTVLGNLTKEIQKEVGFDCEVVLPATPSSMTRTWSLCTTSSTLPMRRRFRLSSLPTWL